MQISDVRIHKITNPSEQKLKALVSVVFDEQFVVHELRVVEGANGLFVAMPRRKTAQGEFKDVAHPITAAAREMVQKAVLEAYREAEAKETVSA
ncbi:MAG: septation protein SpoVG [Symbiobacteriaceae bacterium]|jgi:stage V sporulation protein G|nr:septation protein SpoVG [Symbiobacteriaceae bacterium]